MLKRKIERELRNWKENRGDECLLVNGTRQIGKTFSIRQFGHEYYDEFVEINFIENPLLQSIFDNALDSASVIRQLSLRIPRYLGIDEGRRYPTWGYSVDDKGYRQAA